MIPKYLPIGSVVLLKNTKKKMLIVGLLQTVNDSKKVYDYSACIYPIGIQDSKHLFAFNHEDIETIYSCGYRDDEYFEINAKMIKNSH